MSKTIKFTITDAQFKYFEKFSKNMSVQDFIRKELFDICQITSEDIEKAAKESFKSGEVFELSGIKNIELTAVNKKDFKMYIKNNDCGILLLKFDGVTNKYQIK